MGAVNLVVIVESMRTIVTRDSEEDVNALHVPSLIAVAAALGKLSASHEFAVHLKRPNATLLA